MHPHLIIFCLISTYPFLQYFITCDSEICVHVFIFPGDSSRKLTLLYVANDVIQNSKKKGPEYRAEFVKVLPRVFQVINKLVVCVSVARDNCAYCISANFWLDKNFANVCIVEIFYETNFSPIRIRTFPKENPE